MVIIDGEPEYEVEEVVDEQKRYGQVEFLIKWKGYSEAQNSWELWENCENATEEIENFRRKRGQQTTIGAIKKITSEEKQQLTAIGI